MEEPLLMIPCRAAAHGFPRRGLDAADTSAWVVIILLESMLSLYVVPQNVCSPGQVWWASTEHAYVNYFVWQHQWRMHNSLLVGFPLKCLAWQNPCEMPVSGHKAGAHQGKALYPQHIHF